MLDDPAGEIDARHRAQANQQTDGDQARVQPVEGAEGDFLAIPAQRHNLAALEDSVVLLTVVAH